VERGAGAGDLLEEHAGAAAELESALARPERAMLDEQLGPAVGAASARRAAPEPDVLGIGRDLPAVLDLALQPLVARAARGPVLRAQGRSSSRAASACGPRTRSSAGAASRG